MTCSHCQIAIHEAARPMAVADPRNVDGLPKDRITYHQICPACKKDIIWLSNRTLYPEQKPRVMSENKFLAWPRKVVRSPPKPEVPSKYAEDYIEACLVLDESPKASAALSRRCLQTLLREELKVKPGSLDQEIQSVIDEKSLPSYLLENLDAVRTIGNFSAHPIKSQKTGEIVDVDPGEAEWSLNVLESLFDFQFVQPELIKRKRLDLNKKLSDAGKPPLK